MINMEDNTEKKATGVAVGRVDRPSKPGPEHRLLEIFIGRWINEGETIGSGNIPAVKILTSDVYAWMPGGFFVLHTAYGLIGNAEVGGTEVLSYDTTSKTYQSLFFDSQGNINTDMLSVNGNTWIWQGKDHRATAVFSDAGKTQTVHHERLGDDGNWVPAMDVVLRKVD
jgi:hypothetical protein